MPYSYCRARTVCAGDPAREPTQFRGFVCFARPLGPSASLTSHPSESGATAFQQLGGPHAAVMTGTRRCNAYLPGSLHSAKRRTTAMLASCCTVAGAVAAPSGVILDVWDFRVSVLSARSCFLSFVFCLKCYASVTRAATKTRGRRCIDVACYATQERETRRGPFYNIEAAARSVIHRRGGQRCSNADPKDAGATSAVAFRRRRDAQCAVHMF